MLNSQILEVAIGLAFIYLLFCLICSMVKEWIASAWLKSRPKTLFKGIKSLLKDPEIIYSFYKHPLINALAKRNPLGDSIPPDPEKILKNTLRKQPSSIPASHLCPGCARPAGADQGRRCDAIPGPNS
jgi:hypothetical protein